MFSKLLKNLSSQINDNKNSASDALSSARASFYPPPYDLNAPKQDALDQQLKKILENENYSGTDYYQKLVVAIRSSEPIERQKVLKNQDLIDLMESKVVGSQSSTLISELLVGSLHWQNPITIKKDKKSVYNDFYKYFVKGKGEISASNTRTMNCWESIIYAAYRAGQVEKKWIKDFYETADKQMNPNDSIWKQLNFNIDTSSKYAPEDNKIPDIGQLVFYKFKSHANPGHVAVYVGNQEVISLWYLPNEISSVQRIPIDSFSGEIYYADAPWTGGGGGSW